MPTEKVTTTHTRTHHLTTLILTTHAPPGPIVLLARAAPLTAESGRTATPVVAALGCWLPEVLGSSIDMGAASAHTHTRNTCNNHTHQPTPDIDARDKSQEGTRSHKCFPPTMSTFSGRFPAMRVHCPTGAPAVRSTATPEQTTLPPFELQHTADTAVRARPHTASLPTPAHPQHARNTDTHTHTHARTRGHTRVHHHRPRQPPIPAFTQPFSEDVVATTISGGGEPLCRRLGGPLPPGRQTLACRAHARVRARGSPLRQPRALCHSAN